MASARDGRAVRDRMAARVREVRRMYFFKRQNSFAVEWVQAFLRLKLVWLKERKISGKKENLHKYLGWIFNALRFLF